MMRRPIMAMLLMLGLAVSACSGSDSDGVAGHGANAADEQRTITRSLEDIAAAESAASAPIEESAEPARTEESATPPAVDRAGSDADDADQSA